MWKYSESLDSPSWRGSRGSRGGRGRGRGSFLSESSVRGGWYGQSSPKSVPVASPEPPLGPLLSTVSKHDFDQKAKDFKSRSIITDFRTVATYNWLERTEPTIIIPGKPPKWTPLDSPRQLNLDDGEYLRDVNSANFPKHPMEPAIVAAITMQPNLSEQTDVVACGSTIGNLLRFLSGEDKTFRILVELVGETVFFIRRENTPREIIPDVHGYGHSFPETYTTWDSEVKGSTSHQRVISYRFGGLGFLLRFEGDGYIIDGEDSTQDTSAQTFRTGDLEVGAEIDLLSAEMAGNRVTSKLPEHVDNGLHVIHAGKLVSQDHMFDLKTRSIRKKETETLEMTLNDQLKRLWVAQIPKFILAYHNRGVFEDIHIRDVQNEVNGWETRQVDTLSRLAALIHHIISLVTTRPDHKLELRHNAVGVLEIREQLSDAGDALSEKVKELWEDGKDRASRESSPDLSVCENDTPSEGSSTHGWDDGFEPDFTACSAEDCGYCGRCSY